MHQVRFCWRGSAVLLQLQLKALLLVVQLLLLTGVAAENGLEGENRPDTDAKRASKPGSFSLKGDSRPRL